MEKTVDLRAIEHELGQLWREAVGPGVGMAAAIRASLLNLIVVAPEPNDTAAAEYAAQTVRQLGLPCRIILVLASGDAASPSPNLTARVGLHPVGRTDASQLLYCEQITLAGHEGVSADQVGTILPLLLPDMPVFLWWLGIPPLGSRLFESLTQSCDRLIVDSFQFQPPVDVLIHLADWLQGAGDKLAVSDLNWARITPWREMVAQFFDAPNLLPYLSLLSEVSIEYAAGTDARSNPAQALLVVGWLASRLGWRADSELTPTVQGEVRVAFRRNGSEIRVVIYSTDVACNAPACNLISLRLAASGAQPASFTVRRLEDETCVETAVALDGSRPVARVVSVPVAGDAQLLHDELNVLGRDRIYEDALRAIASFRPQAAG